MSLNGSDSNKEHDLGEGLGVAGALGPSSNDGGDKSGRKWKRKPRTVRSSGKDDHPFASTSMGG